MKQHLSNFTFLTGFLSVLDVSGISTKTYLKNFAHKRKTLNQVWHEDMKSIGGDFHCAIKNSEHYVKGIAEKSTTKER